MLRGVWKLALVEGKLYLRDPVGAFFGVPFPVLFFVLMGSVYGNNLAPEYGGRFGNVDVFVPGFMAMTIAASGLLALSIGIAIYRERGILRRLQATPVGPLPLLASQVAVVVVSAALASVLLVVAGRLGFGLRFAGNPLSVAAAFLIGCLSFCSLGFLLAGLVPTSRSAWVIGSTITFPMIFLSGSLVPTEILPAGIRSFSGVLPLTHLVALLRGTWAGDSWSMHLGDVAVLLGIFAVSLVVGARTFRWN